MKAPNHLVLLSAALLCDQAACSSIAATHAASDAAALAALAALHPQPTATRTTTVAKPSATTFSTSTTETCTQPVDANFPAVCTLQLTPPACFCTYTSGSLSGSTTDPIPVTCSTSTWCVNEQGAVAVVTTTPTSSTVPEIATTGPPAITTGPPGDLPFCSASFWDCWLTLKPSGPHKTSTAPICNCGDGQAYPTPILRISTAMCPNQIGIVYSGKPEWTASNQLASLYVDAVTDWSCPFPTTITQLVYTSQ